MIRTTLLVAVAGLILLFPRTMLAGGPPWLRLPINGVTSDNAKACEELLADKLKGKLWSPRNGDRGIQVQQHSNEWYLTFYMAEDIGLREIEAALQGSKFSLPRDKLRLFGHVILEIDAGTTAPKELLAALEALDQVSVAESKNAKAKNGVLLVTVEMPYPVGKNRPESKPVAWDKFQRNGFASDPTTKSESPIPARMLPSYAAFREIVAKHDASLKDIRWSTNHACRPLGCVTASGPDALISAK